MVNVARQVLLGLIPIVGILWLMNIPLYLNVGIITAQYLAMILALAVAAGLLQRPYFPRAIWLDGLLAAIAVASWGWVARYYGEWLISAHLRGPERWVPGVVGIVLLLEALRKNCGNAIAIMCWILILYGMLGFLLPLWMPAYDRATTRYILYLYADSNGIPGLVLAVGATVVIGFIIFGRAMQISGASDFFTDAAMALMGHRRGGPAKVSVVGSSIFGMVSGSTVANIMSTGVMTIPLMKRSGFPPHYAGAVEAVSSNGGQLAPPVMGATAFLIAEFLELPYGTVVLAALAPAVLYYFVVFMQIDAYAQTHGIKGLPRDQLPRIGRVLRKGWIYVIPIAVLLYFLFWLAYSPGKSALISAAVLVVLWIVRRRSLPGLKEWRDLAVGAGEGLMPLLLITGAAGIVIGTLAISGLGDRLAQMLASVGSTLGLFPLAVLTAIPAIILGMGMPTLAVYATLVGVLAPAFSQMGVIPIATHLFLFYFGLMSMLTPPVAVASYVAAGMAGADMWRTGITGVKLGSAAYLVPFLFLLNSDLLLGQGETLDFVVVAASALAAGYLLAHSVSVEPGRSHRRWRGLGLFAASLGVGASTIVLGHHSVPTFAVLGLVLLYALWQQPGIRARFARPAPAAE